MHAIDLGHDTDTLTDTHNVWHGMMSTYMSMIMMSELAPRCQLKNPNPESTWHKVNIIMTAIITGTSIGECYAVHC